MKKCPYCAEEIQDAAVVCRFCQRSLSTGALNAPTQPVQTWNPGIAAALSFVVPGLGQVYKGHIGRGIALAVTTVLGYFMLIVPGVVLHIYAIFDAYNGKTKDEEQAMRATIAANDPRTPEQQRADKRRSNRQAAIASAIIIGLVLLAVITRVLVVPTSNVLEAPTVPAGADADLWWLRLQHIIVDAGEPCGRIQGTNHIGPRAGENFWKVTCENDEIYVVALKTGATPRVIACKRPTGAAPVECFIKS